MQQFSIGIAEVVDHLGLVRNPQEARDAVSFNVRCPFCNDTKYHMNINTDKNTYRCVRCSLDRKGQGVLDLYGRVALGEPLRHGSDSNAKALFIKLKEELYGKSSYKKIQPVKKQESNPVREIKPATPDKLMAAYHALLHLPCTRLSDTHRSNLIKRGQLQSDIELNEYASLPISSHLLTSSGKKAILQAKYKNISEEDITRMKKVISYYQPDDIMAGMLIADELIARNISLESIPGFFYIESIKQWCLRYIPGMMIPTRNLDNEIIGIQVRRDVKKTQTRYLTISSKGLDRGVTTQIARIHFPISNGTLVQDAVVYLTEGPLKADTAMSLLRQSGIATDHIMFIALQGVNSTTQLPEIAAKLQEVGVRKILNAFDMDKLTNVFVMAASRTISRIFKEHEISVMPLVWDKAYTEQKLEYLKGLCQRHDVTYAYNKQSHYQIALMAQALHSAGIDPNADTEPWDARTKGIDDYLLSCLRERSDT